MEYSDYQNLVSSEKITLAVVSASKRLKGWVLHSGTVYKIENFTFKVIEAIEDSGTEYIEVDDVGSVSAGKYFLDQENEILYLRTSNNGNPNGRFIIAVLKLNFANVPLVAPHDLDAGFEVQFEPLVKSTSEFGVSVDTINQTSEAIEGSGTLTLINDQDFWIRHFDKLSFENQKCRIYSYNRGLNIADVRIIFDGKIEKKSYGPESISFQLKDQFAQLRSPILLATIGELEERTGGDLENAKQRMIFGRVFGHVPTNLDQVLDGYPLTGTVSISNGDLTLMGSSTQFLAQLSPDDQVVLGDKKFTIASVTSNTSATLTRAYNGNVNLSGTTITVDPSRPKRYINRVFKVAGHTLREPETTTVAGSTIRILFVVSTRDIHESDVIYIGDLGSGETAIVESVIGDHYIRLSTSLATAPAEGVAVRRPAIQNVRLGSVLLTYERDYSFDAETAVLTLKATAEANASAILNLGATVTFTNTSSIVSGSGFQGMIEPGYMLGAAGNAEFFEVLAVDSDTQITLRTPSTFTSMASGRYKDLIFDPSEMVLTCDALGRTDDGTTNGVLVKTAPAVSRTLLIDAGVSDFIDSASFDEAEDIAYQDIGIVIPEIFDDDNTPTYRDVMNKVNQSVFGTLVQNSDYEFAYQVLRPKKTTTATRFMESDILSFSVNATAENVVKTCVVQYRPKEYDYLSKKNVISTQQKTSDKATYVVKTDRVRTIPSILVEESDAHISACRWSFLLEGSTGVLNFTTKMQGMLLEVGSIIEVDHRKLFQRLGGTDTRKLLLVESVKRSGSTVQIEATDFSNTFNRVAAISSSSSDYSSATDDEKLYGGFITDEFGLIDDDPETAETNLIW